MKNTNYGKTDEARAGTDRNIEEIQFQPTEQNMTPWGTPERPFAWKLTGHSEDFDNCGTAQAMLETEGGKMTVEVLAGDYASVKDAAALITAAPELLVAVRAFQEGLRDGSIQWAKKRQSAKDPYHPANTAMCVAIAKAEGRA